MEATFSSLGQDRLNKIRFVRKGKTGDHFSTTHHPSLPLQIHLSVLHLSKYLPPILPATKSPVNHLFKKKKQCLKSASEAFRSIYFKIHNIQEEQCILRSKPSPHYRPINQKKSGSTRTYRPAWFYHLNTLPRSRARRNPTKLKQTQMSSPSGIRASMTFSNAAFK